MPRLRFLLPLVSLSTTLACSDSKPKGAGEKGCQSNDDCNSGYVCAASDCLELCNVQSDCDGGTICQSGTCVEPSSGDLPVINSIVGNNPEDATRIQNGLVVSGLLLAGADFELRTGSDSEPLDVGSQSATEAEVFLPADVESGTHTLVATNGAGSTQGEVVLELPEMNGDWLIDRINTTATDREIGTDFLPVGAAADTVAAGNDARFQTLADGLDALGKGQLDTALTGTVTVGPGSDQLAGVGTLFTTELIPGDALMLDAEVFEVAAIAGDLSLTLTAVATTGHTGITAYTDGDLLTVDTGAATRRLRVAKSGELFADAHDAHFAFERWEALNGWAWLVVGQTTDNMGQASVFINGDDGDHSGSDYASITHYGETGNLGIYAGGGDGTNHITFSTQGNTGNVGIGGVSDPVERLEVGGNILATNKEMSFHVFDTDQDTGWTKVIIGETNDNTGKASIFLNGDDGDAGGGDYAIFTHDGASGSLSIGTGGGNGTGHIALLPSGNVGIGLTDPSEALEVTGNILASGTITPGSSRKLKERIQPLDEAAALEALGELEPTRFYYKADPEEEHIGFVAEDVPDIVASKDRRGVSPLDISGVLTKVVQQQQRQLEEQQRRIEQLEARLAERK